MVGTNTPRYTLYKADPNDAVNVTQDITANWDKIDPKINRGIIARHVRTTSATTTTQTVLTSAQGIFRIDNIAIEASRLYEITLEFNYNSSATGRVKTLLTTSTAGAADATSTVLIDAQHNTLATDLVEQSCITVYYTNASNATLSIFYGHYIVSGAGTGGRFASANLPQIMTVKEIGVDTGPSGGVNL